MTKKHLKTHALVYAVLCISSCCLWLGCGNRIQGQEFTLVSYQPDVSKDNIVIRDSEGHTYSDVLNPVWYPIGDKMECIGYCDIAGDNIPIYAYEDDEQQITIFLQNGNRRPGGELDRVDFTYPNISSENIDSIRYFSGEEKYQTEIEKEPIRDETIVSKLMAIISDLDVGAATDKNGIIDERNIIIAERIGELELYNDDLPFLCATVGVLQKEGETYYYDSIGDNMYIWPDQGTLEMIIAATPE